MPKRVVSIIVFPGSNCDRDLAIAIQKHLNVNVKYVWHNDSKIEHYGMIFIPGGFSFGDYLRAGVLATKSPAIKEVVKFAKKGFPVVGICNGFQILTECMLLDGTLINNKSQLFICDDVFLKVQNITSKFTKNLKKKILKLPIAHAQGNYFTTQDSLKKLEDNNQIIFKYCCENGSINKENNPNGSMNNIAGITNKQKNILGMMPHPERAIENFGSQDGKNFFDGLREFL